MPNWCDTTYKCVGDLKEVRSLYKIIKANDKRKTPRVKNGFGTLWLGCIINALGEDWEQLRCRGEITDYQLEDNILTISQNTAWCEQEGFVNVLKRNILLSRSIIKSKSQDVTFSILMIPVVRIFLIVTSLIPMMTGIIGRRSRMQLNMYLELSGMKSKQQ